ncbi:MAG TPA: addiction module protein [Pyrinomonadaceae bacterium]|nr:addiction module protein [Pyrinomonadaceae bacterium]
MSLALPERALELLSTPLSVDQRLELIGLLWDSIPDEELPLPDWHRQELERRLQAAETNPTTSISWEHVKTRLRGKR